MSRAEDDSSLFDLGSDDWVELVRAAETPEAFGSLGQYQLVAEAGRGGQGVVYRAQQPGTGRTIAVKRLLAGTLASPAALRRFEREIEASTALNHPGIVTVYGADVIDGAPVLTMEWVEGVPITTWARGRPRTEVLRCFLGVCDAVQHAHQRGVLHRDLKPSNVVVDEADRPRVLDFGLAKLVSDGASSITASRGFVGTPAYAAPEQWRGEELDVRAEVYSLGALLFEMLTGRRLVEGEGLDALLRAAESLTPLRPSAYTRSVPRELDAIVGKAVAAEPAERFQSVDAFADDLRRFLSGAPVLAHPPSTWYVLRKLCARNPWSAAAFAALVLATAGYAASSIVQAGRLAQQRDRARAEQENAERVLSFLLDDVITAADPSVFGHQPTLLEILRQAAPRVPERFTGAAAARVHHELARAFMRQGSYGDAVAEARRALAESSEGPAFGPSDLAVLEMSLAEALYHAGEYGEAQPLARKALAVFEQGGPGEQARLYAALHVLGSICKTTGALGEALELSRRAMAAAPSALEKVQERLTTSSLLYKLGKTEECLAEGRIGLAEAIALEGESSVLVAKFHGDIGGTLELLGRDAEAEAELRLAIAILERVLGPDHPDMAEPLSTLAVHLADKKKLVEAEELARRGLEISEKSGLEETTGHAVCVFNLGLVDVALGRGREAEQHMSEALSLLERHVPRTDYRWRGIAKMLHRILRIQRKFDQADRWFEEIEGVVGPEDRGWLLASQADRAARQGDLDGAIRGYDEALDVLWRAPMDTLVREALDEALEDFATLLRETGDSIGARELELERQALRMGRVPVTRQ
jgi:tetratricopeptide (TPR) repeat protein